MANIIRRNERRNQNADLAPMFSPMWEPFQILRELGSLGWPHRGLEAFREIGPMMMERAFAPRFDVKETRDAYVFTADMPGVRDDDLEISVTGNHLLDQRPPRGRGAPGGRAVLRIRAIVRHLHAQLLAARRRRSGSRQRRVQERCAAHLRG